MPTANKRVHKHFQLDSVKIKRAQKVLRAKTETETIERALDFTITEHERDRLAWEANARVAIAEQKGQHAEDCIAQGLLIIEGYEVPLAAWRVHGTSAELHARAGKSDLAKHHRELSRATIMKLANSLDPEDPLRATFLSAPPVRRVIDYADRIGT